MENQNEQPESINEIIDEIIKYFENIKRDKILELKSLLKVGSTRDDERSKLAILNIVMRYQCLMTYISIFPGFRRSFVQSNLYRHWMLGKETIYVHKDGGIKDENGNDKSVVKTKPTGDRCEEYIKWEGVKMTIPESAYISLSRGATWTSMYIREKGSDLNNGDVEISIFEKPMHIEILSNDPDTFDLDQNGKPLITEEDRKKVKYSGMLEGEVEIVRDLTLKDEDSSFAFSRAERFSCVRVEIRKLLEEFEIVLEIPYFTPADDMLTEVKFGSQDNVPDIVMSCS